MPVLSHRITRVRATQGLTINDVPFCDEQRRRTWFAVPVESPGWYVQDTALELRAVGHSYALPKPIFGGGVSGGDRLFSPKAWEAPDLDQLRNIKPPSGFPNVCYRVDGVGAGSITLLVRGFDAQMNPREETVEVTVAVGITRVWGLVPWRQIESVKILDASGIVAGTDLYIGWSFAPALVSAAYNAPREDAGNWRTGFPWGLQRDSVMGAPHVHNVHGLTVIDLCGWEFDETGVDVNRNAASTVIALGFFEGGGIGRQGDSTPIRFNDGTFDLQDNLDTWVPPGSGQARPAPLPVDPAGGRPRLYAGISGGQPVNICQSRMYAFFLSEQPADDIIPLQNW